MSVLVLAHTVARSLERYDSLIVNAVYGLGYMCVYNLSQKSRVSEWIVIGLITRMLKASRN